MATCGFEGCGVPLPGRKTVNRRCDRHKKTPKDYQSRDTDRKRRQRLRETTEERVERHFKDTQRKRQKRDTQSTDTSSLLQTFYDIQSKVRRGNSTEEEQREYIMLQLRNYTVYEHQKKREVGEKWSLEGSDIPLKVYQEREKVQYTKFWDKHEWLDLHTNGESYSSWYSTKLTNLIKKYNVDVNSVCTFDRNVVRNVGSNTYHGYKTCICWGQKHNIIKSET